MDSPSIDDVIRLESAVWQALVDGDASADAAALSADFLGVLPTGFANRDDHADQLVDGPTVAVFRLREPRLLVVSEAAVLLAYRAEYQRPGSPPSDAPEAMYVSSLWCRREHRWVNVFSQDTPVGDLAVP